MRHPLKIYFRLRIPGKVESINIIAAIPRYDTSGGRAGGGRGGITPRCETLIYEGVVFIITIFFRVAIFARGCVIARSREEWGWRNCAVKLRDYGKSEKRNGPPLSYSVDIPPWIIPVLPYFPPLRPVSLLYLTFLYISSETISSVASPYSAGGYRL